MRDLEPGQTLEVRATDPTVQIDLLAWSRLAGHVLLKQQHNHYLLRRAG